MPGRKLPDNGAAPGAAPCTQQLPLGLCLCLPVEVVAHQAANGRAHRLRWGVGTAC